MQALFGHCSLMDVLDNMLQSQNEHCIVTIRPKSIWSRLPPPTATDIMLQGEHLINSYKLIYTSLTLTLS